MKKCTALLLAALCAFTLCACLPAGTPAQLTPQVTEASAVTEAPTEVPAEETPAPSEEPVSTEEPAATEAPANTDTPVSPAQTTLTAEQLAKMENLLSIVAGAVQPKDGFEKEPTALQGQSALCIYVNHMTNSQLQKAGTCKDDMLWLTQEQAEALYEHLFENGDLAFAENPDYGLVMREGKLCVMLASGESLLVAIDNYTLAPDADGDDLLCSVQFTLTQEFAEEMTYAGEAVLEAENDSPFGFTVVSLKRGELVTKE